MENKKIETIANDKLNNIVIKLTIYESLRMLFFFIINKVAIKNNKIINFEKVISLYFLTNKTPIKKYNKHSLKGDKILRDVNINKINTSIKRCLSFLNNLLETKIKKTI
jgi:hypothetical protein